MTPPYSKSWPEDFAHENGNYNCKCSTCSSEFIGHKRRFTCRECHDRHQLEFKTAVNNARVSLIPGDRIRASHGCRNPATFTFVGWDGNWIVSKSGINDIPARSITSVNGIPIDFRTTTMEVVA